MVQDYMYDAFGVEEAPDEADTNPFRYAGEYYDSEAGLTYLRARYYAPVTGRFTSEDPAQDGLNWYSYCAGNPISYVDPSGQALILTNEADAQYTVSLISKASGYNGYWYEEMDDGRYKIVDLNDGVINGGSRVARGMVNAAIADENEIVISYAVTENGSQTYMYSKGNIIGVDSYKYNEREQYTDRSVEIVVASNAESVTLSFFHELAHGLTWNLEQDNELVIPDQYKHLAPDIRGKYLEAVAITLANTISAQLGLGIYDSYYRDTAYTINSDGSVHEIILPEPEVYGAFPMQYTDGNARIPVKYGYGIGMFYIFNYTLGPQGR